jgi:large-conductance mechanosensitive channel
MFIQKFYNDFQTFVYSNDLLKASSAFIFGMISKDYIDKFLSEILYPLIFSFIVFKSTLEKIEKETPIIYILLKFIWITFIWIFTLFISFFILEYILNRNVVGLSSTVLSKEEKKNYLDMKAEAKISGIIPNGKEIKEIEKDNEIIERKINERYMNIEEFI